jgi:hypothetical protein
MQCSGACSCEDGGYRVLNMVRVYQPVGMNIDQRFSLVRVDRHDMEKLSRLLVRSPNFSSLVNALVIRERHVIILHRTHGLTSLEKPRAIIVVDESG